MAEETPQQSNNAGTVTNSFNKGMLKDYNDTFVGDGLWTHARNAINNSHDGQVGVIGNEPSNLFCVALPYTLIGAIHVLDDQWVVFTTDDTHSEIGIFDESACSYKKIVNASCLNFKRSHLITGTTRIRFDCERLIYWDDGLNPTRTMNIDDVPYKYTDRILNGCIERTFTDELDCERIRIAQTMAHPCIIIKKGNIAGTLPNGSYQACIAYTRNQVRVSDYLGLSEVQGLWTYENVSSSLELTITSIDKDYDEFELVILSNINGQAVAKRIGYYSTVQGTIYVDRWDLEYVTVPITDIVVRTETVEKSDAMYNVNNYLLRVGTYSKYKFNYQPQANKIRTTWASVEYPSTYYVNGGNNTGYLRDEVYAFFIRFVYNTGERSESYHIPGRAPNSNDTNVVTDDDAFETQSGIIVRKWQVENTGAVSSLVPQTLSDGGKVIARGTMGYWQSTERYPADKPDIYGSLCGQPIRHHKMPDVTIDPILNHFGNQGNSIYILGVEFTNITPPLDQNGNVIESIVGYEILRGSREGAKSIVGKGIFNNMRQYTIPGTTTVTGLYQNYPYNDLRVDPYLTSTVQNGDTGRDVPNTPGLSGYRKDIFSFHSPEVSFSFPYLNLYEAKFYQEIYGTARGTFEIPFEHPKFRQITNSLDSALDILATAIAVIEAAAATIGGYTKEISSDQSLPSISAGIPYVSAEGSFGTIADVLNPIAITTNLIFNGLYVALFGAKVSKQQLLGMVLALIPYRQFAAQYNSHGFYSDSADNIEGNRRRKVLDASYVGSSIQQFTGDYQINNVNRSKFLTVQIEGSIDDPTNIDDSRFTIGSRATTWGTALDSNICSYYGAIKVAIPSQYGQLESVKQYPISYCIHPMTMIANTSHSTGVLFGGDTYIGRFTEKNSMFFFNTWLSGEQDGIEFDYTLYSSIPYPRYWINSIRYIGLFADNPGKHRSLDALAAGNFFYINKGYFYLFNSGVRDFFVESEINLAYRDWEDIVAKRHYDPNGFTDLNLMFRSDVIQSGNYYEYDYSLSISKLFNSNITWGSMLTRDYDPATAATCYVYRPNRVIYSLPQQDQSKKDSWRAFLVNNYKDFESPITSIKSINKTGALFMMARQSPLMFMGTEELKLDGTGAKVTIGDGALFGQGQQLQQIVNADDPYEYGSCQNRYSVIGTSRGVFWVSQNQGKVFQYAGELKEISANGLKYWFAKYLPSQLLAVYPEYTQKDNPILGVGVQVIFDNVYEILYIVKKDYKPLRKDFTYDSDGKMYLNNSLVTFSNTNYFEECSFTASYDCKSQTWISFHDWIPTFLLPGRNHFMSVVNDTIWKHNIRCDSYCNYYNKDYPFEIEFVSATGQQVTTIRSIEYLLEVYNYYNDCRDKFHILDANFDEAMIYNSEQISGILKLNIKDKVNPLNMLNYPRITATGIEINFSKEENKYRFNQFWDVTKDRGEFSNRKLPLINVEPNGYIYAPNPNAIDYSKATLQRKKFRHNTNRVWLRKTVSGANKFIFKVSNQKLLPSYR